MENLDELKIAKRIVSELNISLEGLDRTTIAKLEASRSAAIANFNTQTVTSTGNSLLMLDKNHLVYMVIGLLFVVLAGISFQLKQGNSSDSFEVDAVLSSSSTTWTDSDFETLVGDQN